MTRVCEHMPEDYVERFTGHGIDAELTCDTCARGTVEADSALIKQIRDQERVRFEGQPGVIERASSLWFEVEQVAIACDALTDLKPFGRHDRNCWLGVTADARVIELDLDRGETRELARVDVPKPILHVSRDGRYVAVVEDHGLIGVIIDPATGRELTRLVRDDYHARHCEFPFAFITRGERELAVYSPEWNRLAMFDVATNEAVSARPAIPHRDRHYLDYFHSGLHVSPSGAMIADTGWVWQPVGVVASWSIDHWLHNPYESEDGPSLRNEVTREAWDLPLCWLDDTRFAIAGHGDYCSSFGPAVEIVDARSGKLASWFAGPEGELAFDRVLFSLGEATSAWDVETGARVARTTEPFDRYHPGAKCLAAMPEDGRMAIGRLCGGDEPWMTDRIRALAASIDDPAAQLGVLGDTLDDDTDPAVLAHCRAPGPHGRRCWVLDRLARR